MRPWNWLPREVVDSSTLDLSEAWGCKSPQAHWGSSLTLNSGREGGVSKLYLSQPRLSKGMRTTMSASALSLWHRAWRAVSAARDLAREVVVSAARGPWGQPGIVMETHCDIRRLCSCITCLMRGWGCPACRARPSSDLLSCLNVYFLGARDTFGTPAETGGAFTESQNQLGWKRPQRSSSPTLGPTLVCLLDHGTKCHVQSQFKNLQGRRIHHLPGQAVAMPDHSLCKEFLPNI